jgi:hypothetical protein
MRKLFTYRAKEGERERYRYEMRQIHLSQAGVANGSIVVIYMNSQSFQFTNQKTMEEKSFYRTPRLSVSDFAILSLSLSLTLYLSI